jgi:hypothetical protein
MNKVSGANVRRLLNLFLFKARLKGCFLARVGDHLPRLRLHLSSPSIAAPHDIHVTRAVLAGPNIFSAGAVHRIDRLLLRELPFADWAGFGHYVGHDLASRSTGTTSSGYHIVVLDARECAKATC